MDESGDYVLSDSETGQELLGDSETYTSMEMKGDFRSIGGADTVSPFSGGMIKNIFIWFFDSIGRFGVEFIFDGTDVVITKEYPDYRLENYKYESNKKYADIISVNGGRYLTRTIIADSTIWDTMEYDWIEVIASPGQTLCSKQSGSTTFKFIIIEI